MIALKLIAFVFAGSAVATPLKALEETVKESDTKRLENLLGVQSKLISKEYGPIPRADVHPDAGLNVIELIQKYGYPVEQHKDIETDDGYLLEIHRIPHGKNNSDVKNRPVVYVQHGLLGSSGDWIAMGPGQGLAYILADAGFDVWLGNFRGNTWSRKHKIFDADKNKKKFWNFSWHEMGLYDIPAMIDHIMEVTKVDKIFYVGHSQGTTAFFVTASERPWYMKRIKMMTAMAPVVFMGHSENLLLKFIVSLNWLVSALTEFIGMYEFLPSSELLTTLGQILCHDEAISQSVCTNILFLIAGYNSQQLNVTMLPVLFSLVPAGAASKQFFHYAQEISTDGEFKQYDYGWWTNLFMYGSFHPPKYDISKANIPIALFYADTDNFAAVEDVDLLYRNLPSPILKKKIRDYNHLDFLYAINAPKIYEHIISLMERY